MNCGRRQEGSGLSGHVGRLKCGRLALKVQWQKTIFHLQQRKAETLANSRHFWKKQFQINLNMKSDPAYSAPWRKLGKSEMSAGKICC